MNEEKGSTGIPFNEPAKFFAIQHMMTNSSRKQQHCCCTSNNSGIATHRAATAAAAAALRMHTNIYEVKYDISGPTWSFSAVKPHTAHTVPNETVKKKELYGSRNVDLKCTRQEIYLLNHPVSYIFILRLYL